MFGKPVSEYLRFQRAILVALVVVGFARLGASLAGLPDASVKWLAMNAVIWAGAVYYGVAAPWNGFTRYRQLLPLSVIQAVVFQLIAVIGILLAIAGLPNIFAAPEYSFQGQSQGIHALAHLTIGILAPSLLLWGLSSLVMLITKKVAAPPAVARTTA